MTILYCKHCDKICKNSRSLSAHERMCPKNKDRNYVSHTLGKTAWNKGKTKETCEITRKISNTLKEGFKTGRLKPWGVAILSKEERSKNAKKQGFGGYNEKAGNSKIFYVEDSYSNKVCLQSTYELRCSDILNKLKIKWIRPKYLNYSLDGKTRKYYPDFYLVDYDIYLDPKNDFLAKKDRLKIELASNENDVNIIILKEEMINEKFIKSIIMN